MKTLQIKVKPNARASTLVEQDDGTWLAHVKAVPVDGKANDELLLLISRHFSVRKAQVTIRSGASARMKLIQLDN